MTAFFAPFVSLLVSLGLLHAQPAVAHFPSVEWFAQHLQVASSSGIASEPPRTIVRTATVPITREAVPAVATPRKQPELISPAASTTGSPAAPQQAAAKAQTAAAASSPVQTGSELSALEQAVLVSLNAARTAEGLKPLAADARLSDIARAHSEDMLATGYFSHDDRSGCSASCRYQNAGYPFSSMGENIFWMSGYNLSIAASAAKVVESWQNSPGHRANDLGDYANVGIGVARTGVTIYVTADFATPR